MRQRIWEIVEVARAGDAMSRGFDVAILTLITLNVIAVILESIPSLRAAWGPVFHAVELVSIIVFTIEYVTRLVTCGVDPRYRGLAGVLRFAITPMAIIDLVAILPFFLPALGIDLRFVRVLRLLRILRVLKLARYIKAMHLFGNVVRARREELLLTSALMGLLLVIASCLMYAAEHEAQPEVFADIPTTMWWAVVTLTTVGYGDLYPVTTVGKLCGATVAILGVAVVALPTGILGAGFVEEIQKQKRVPACPHCGREI